MIDIKLDLFPGGKRKAVTLSYDDGVIHDRRLVEILNRHGVKASFHLNSGFLGDDGKLAAAEIQELFRGHEISAHSVSHPNLDLLPIESLAWQMLEDRRALEALAGYPVRGMSYPNGGYNAELARKLPGFGIEYARTTRSHGGFHLPEDLLQWHPTCHHKDNLLKRTEDFIKVPPWRGMPLLYVWGHSYEFDQENNWDLIECFAEQIGEASDSVWFATNIEIADYLRALRQLRVSVDGSLVQNLSHLPVWISAAGEPYEIAPGALLQIAPTPTRA